jgi:hypothetical protein
MTVIGAPVCEAGSSVAAAETTTACCSGPTDSTTSIDERPCAGNKQRIGRTRVEPGCVSTNLVATFHHAAEAELADFVRLYLPLLLPVAQQRDRRRGDARAKRIGHGPGQRCLLLRRHPRQHTHKQEQRPSGAALPVESEAERGV